MTDEQFKNLKRGDIIRNQGSNNSYVVDIIYKDHVIAVTSVDASNPSEWDLIEL